MELLSQPAFGRLLRKLRSERGLSQADLVGPGVSASYVSRLESGSRAVTEQAAGRLADRLGVPVAVFAGAADRGGAAALLASGLAALDDGRAAEAVRDLTEAAGAAGPDDLAWQALWHLSTAHARLGDRRAQRDALALLRPLLAGRGVAALEVRAYASAADCERELGEADSAVALAREALRLAEGGAAAGRVEALRALTAAEAEAGRLTEASDHADQLLALLGEVHGAQRVRVLWAASLAYARRGAEEKSLPLLEEALDGADAQEDLLSWARLRLAASLLELRVHGSVTPAAERWCGEAETALHMIGLPRQLPELHAVRARMAFVRGDFAGAAELAGRALATPDALSYHDRVRAEILLHQSEAAGGSFDSAVAELRRIAGEVTRSGNLDLAAEAWKALADGVVGDG